jgi:hypothetical protein
MCRSSSSVFEVQRLWVRDIMGNKMSAGSKRGSAVGVTDEQSEWALMPVLSKEDACTRCKSKFNVKNNSSDSCRCHVDGEGAYFSLTPCVNFVTSTCYIRCIVSTLSNASMICVWYYQGWRVSSKRW